MSRSKKFTLDDWYQNIRAGCRNSEVQQELADRLISESECFCNQTAQKVVLNKRNTDFRLKEQIEDIKFYKSELALIRKETLLELESLSLIKVRLSNALSSVSEKALAICEECLNLRQKRLGIDLVKDEVENELNKECDLIKQVKTLLQRVLEETEQQMRRLRAVLYFLDKDLGEKDDNLRIDRCNLNSKETFSDMKLHLAKATFAASNVSLEEWETQTNKNITAAAKELNGARRIKCYIDTILKRVADDLIAQKHATENAFTHRINEIKEAKIRLETQHAEIMRRADEMTQNVARIEKSIVEKEGFIALSHARSKNRSRRPFSEVTRDLVEANLYKEFSEMQKVVANLRNTLFEAQTSLRRLLKTQIQLEEDINIKTNTIQIDEVDCMSLQHNIVFHAY